MINFFYLDQLQNSHFYFNFFFIAVIHREEFNICWVNKSSRKLNLHAIFFISHIFFFDSYSISLQFLMNIFNKVELFSRELLLDSLEKFKLNYWWIIDIHIEILILFWKGEMWIIRITFNSVHQTNLHGICVPLPSTSINHFN